MSARKEATMSSEALDLGQQAEALDLRAAPRSTALTAPGDMPEQLLGMFQQALALGEAGVGALERLTELHERMSRRRAELEFALALSEFQSACPSIQKSSTAKVTPRSGAGGYEFKYADLEEIITTVRPHLSERGFSFTFDSEASGQMLKCTCILRHSHGHSQSSSFTLPTENASGASAQQKFGGALTYAKRMCLVSVLGLALTDPDPEQRAKDAAPKITDEQSANLDALLDETKADRSRFFSRFNIVAVAELPVALYAEAVRLLELKRGRAAK